MPRQPCINNKICDGYLYSSVPVPICFDCHCMFGEWISTDDNNSEYLGKAVLTFHGKLECPICLEDKESVSQPRCNHTLCLDCFRRCYYGPDLAEPPFPHKDLEHEYYSDMESSKWQDFPEIVSWEIEMGEFIRVEEEIYEEEEYLRKCPLCKL